MAEERVDQNTEQESQDALVETLADRVLLRVQQKLQSQEGRAHESGSVSGDTSGGEPSQSKGPGGEGKSFVASPQLPEVVFQICKASQAELCRTGFCSFGKGLTGGFCHGV